VTTWPAFAEAMYRLGQVSGWPAQDRLWGQAIRRELLLADFAPEAMQRSRGLMQRYAGLPMDLADATLVALAEERGFRRIFTLDSDFYVYRLANGRTLEVVP
jgi:predicted nucleic acid-binding protein